MRVHRAGRQRSSVASTRPGRTVALLRRRPLGTVHATFTAHGPSKPHLGWRVVQERAGLVPLCLLALLAVDVHEMVVLIVVAAVVQGQRLSADGLAGGGEPLCPFFWGLWFVIGV